MSGANKLKAELLENADSESQRAFAKMLAEECSKEDLRAKGHKCWTYIPDPITVDALKKYSLVSDACPKCGSGRLVLEIFKGDIAGDSLWIKCYWSRKEGGCDFRECLPYDEDKV